MTNAYTREQVVSRLSEYITKHGKRTTAERFGCPVQHIDGVLRGERPPTPKILAGLQLVKRYVPAPTPTNKERP